MKREKQNFGNSFNTQRNSAISSMSATAEYGSDLRLTSPTSSSFINTPITTNGAADAWQPHFTWNSTDGYTLGVSHSHPGGNAPSPDDVFFFIENLTGPELTAAGTNAAAIYRRNAYMSAVTSTGTFVVTVKNWGTLQGLYDEFNNDVVEFDNRYRSMAADYAAINHVDNGTATAYALSKLFGDAISVYKAAPGSSNFAIAGVEDNGKLVIVPCP